MEDKKKWLFRLIRKFREILDKEEYKDYQEFFPAFCSSPYLSVILREFYDKNGNHVRNILSLSSATYGDEVNITEERNIPWLDYVGNFLNSLNDFTSLVVDSGDASLKNIKAIQKYYWKNQEFLTNFSTQEYRNTINLPLDFLERDITKLIKALIDKDIFE